VRTDRLVACRDSSCGLEARHPNRVAENSTTEVFCKYRGLAKPGISHLGGGGRGTDAQAGGALTWWLRAKSASRPIGDRRVGGSGPAAALGSAVATGGSGFDGLDWLDWHARRVLVGLGWFYSAVLWFFLFFLRPFFPASGRGANSEEGKPDLIWPDLA
jgi:hypothetical protein